MPMDPANIDTVVYNNIRLRGVRTERFDQEIRYNDQGNTDELFQVFRIGISCLVHADFEGTYEPSMDRPEGSDNGGFISPGESSATRQHFANARLPSVLETRIADAPERMAALQRLLTEPGATFEYYTGGHNLLTVGGFKTIELEGGRRDAERSLSLDAGNQGETSGEIFLYDANYGPRPTCRITEVTAGNIFRIEFAVELAVVLCEYEVGGERFTVPKGPQRQSKRGPEEQGGVGVQPKETDSNYWDAVNQKWLMTHVWSYVEKKDETFYSTKTLSGTVRVADHTLWPHLMRYVVIPPLQDTYQRINQEFEQSEDRLTLRYRVEDKQRFAAPPWPAVDWKCTQTNTTTPFVQAKDGHVHRMVTNFDIELIGAPGTHKPSLLKTCFDVLESRMQLEARRAEINPELPGAKDPTSTETPSDRIERIQIVRHVQVTDVLHENRVQLKVRVESTPLTKKESGTQQQQTAEWLAALYGTTVENMGEPIAARRQTMVGTESNLYGYDPKRWPEPGLYDSAEPLGVFANYIHNACSSVQGIPWPVQLTRGAIGETEFRQIVPTYNSPPSQQINLDPFSLEPKYTGEGAPPWVWRHNDVQSQFGPEWRGPSEFLGELRFSSDDYLANSGTSGVPQQARTEWEPIADDESTKQPAQSGSPGTNNFRAPSVSFTPDHRPIRVFQTDESGSASGVIEPGLSVGDADPPPQLSAKNSNFAYSSVEVETDYIFDEGLIGLPTMGMKKAEESAGNTSQQQAGQEQREIAQGRFGGAQREVPESSVKFFKLHKGVTYRITRMTVERIGDWPEIPKGNDNQLDPNNVRERLVDKKIAPDTPTLLSDGQTWMYRIHCYFKYILEGHLQQDTHYLRAASDPSDRTYAKINLYDMRDRSSDDYYESDKIPERIETPIQTDPNDNPSGGN